MVYQYEGRQRAAARLVDTEFLPGCPPIESNYICYGQIIQHLVYPDKLEIFKTFK